MRKFEIELRLRLRLRQRQDWPPSCRPAAGKILHTGLPVLHSARQLIRVRKIRPRRRWRTSHGRWCIVYDACCCGRKRGERASGGDGGPWNLPALVCGGRIGRRCRQLPSAIKCHHCHEAGAPPALSMWRWVRWRSVRGRQIRPHFALPTYSCLWSC